MLNGKKTYICAACIAAAVVAHQLGYLDNEHYQLLLGLFNAGGLAALRNAK